jgi:LDH2 family malate/lactate/ureidoglycolate dehydrogenase
MEARLHGAQQDGTAVVGLEPGPATGYAVRLLAAAGASEANARVVAEHLVGSDARGVRSHGLLRVPQYVAEMDRGEIDGRATPAIDAPLPGRIRIDGRRAFGQVSARVAVEEAAAAAGRVGVALAATSRIGHAGRIGAYTEELAWRGFVAVAFCSGPRSGHWVAPFGGVEGRLATNPISFACPTGGDPVVADFSTSTLPEGVVRRLRDIGEPAPPGSLQDAAGVPTRDPHVLYDDPRGTILPLGGEAFGHKGYALGLLVETMTTVLGGEDPADGGRFGNDLTLLAVAADDATAASAAALVRYLRTTPPARPDRPVLVPGDPERAALGRGGAIEIDGGTWASLIALGERLGVDPPDPVRA